MKILSRSRFGGATAALCLVSILLAQPDALAGWSETVEVQSGTTRCVGYRAKLSRGWLFVEASHAPGWHTYAMDNAHRAQEKLRGQPSLGIEAPTEVKILAGLKQIGPWYQSRPNDYSKPELQWFTWGFQGQAFFATRVSRSGDHPVKIAIMGQACNASTCRQVEVEIALVEDRDPERDEQQIDTQKLVRVATVP